MTNAEIRSNVFAQIDKLIEGQNVTQFKIIGYKYLDIRLILIFHDCKRIYEWEYQSIKPKVFWTKDYDSETREIDQKDFIKQMEEDVPEIK